MRLQLERQVEGREDGDDDQLALAEGQDRTRQHLAVAVLQDPSGEVRMEPGHLSDHPLVDGAVDASAQGLAATPTVAAHARGLWFVGSDLLEGGEGVDRPGVAGERDELQERLVEAGRRRARPEGGADLAAQRPLASPRCGRRDARQA